MDQITQVVSWTDTLKDTAVGEQRRPWGGERIDDGLIDISGTPKAKKAPKADPARAARRKSPLTEDEKDQAKRKTELERRRLIAVYAYFSPSWTAFQVDGGRDFNVVVDGVSV